MSVRAADAAAPSELQRRLARDILAYVRGHRLGAGAHIPEARLAAEFNVSRSPVRRALQHLGARGFVEQRANRGFFVTESGAGAEPGAVGAAASSDEQISIDLARDRVAGTMPDSFTESEFRRRYRLGRAAATRVLVKLAGQGVITRNRGHGWRFEPGLHGRAAHDESYAFRMIVEPAAILSEGFALDPRAAALCRGRHEQILRAREDGWSVADLFGLDAEFHELVGASCGNRFMEAAIRGQNRLRRLVEYGSLVGTGRMAASCREHLAILDALEAGERGRAAALMRDHLGAAAALGAALFETEEGE